MIDAALGTEIDVETVDGTVRMKVPCWHTERHTLGYRVMVLHICAAIPWSLALLRSLIIPQNSPKQKNYYRNLTAAKTRIVLSLQQNLQYYGRLYRLCLYQYNTI